MRSELAVDRAPRHGPFPGRLDAQRISAYAAAAGEVTAEAWAQARGGVHGEQDVVRHRPLLPGAALDTFSQLSSIRTTRAGTQVVLHIEQRDAQARWWLNSSGRLCFSV
jgi:hypothetical protein